MKKATKRLLVTLAILSVIAFIVYVRLQPVRAFNDQTPYKGTFNFNSVNPQYDPAKKTVLVMADNNCTEMFDMMAPFYLFSATGKANVFIVAEKKTPITMKQGPYVLPHFTFSEIDSIKMRADVIVIPYMNDPEGQVKTQWIRDHYSDSTRILSICDGAWTAAATGLYDGKLLTAHASDFEKVKKGFTKPIWVQQVSYTQSGNLFSTAGVSNAVEGSLAVINDLFGRETMQSVLKDVNYYRKDIQKDHRSVALNTRGIVSALTKMIFRKNTDVGILLQDGVSEFDLAGIFDSYNRTLPSSIKAFLANGTTVTSKFGLTLIPTGDWRSANIDELHVIKPRSLSQQDLLKFKNAEIVSYQHDENYIINTCLERISKEYGDQFQKLVRTALDYN